MCLKPKPVGTLDRLLASPLLSLLAGFCTSPLEQLPLREHAVV
jgi:hypothetical protein